MVRPGYKQTEVGEIPEDWDVKEIRQVCTLINGRGFKPFEWKKHGLPIIRIQNLNGSDEFNYYQGGYDKKLEVSYGQLLFAWSGSRGTSFGPHVWKGDLGLLNYHTWKVVINNDCVDPGFFLHGLRNLTKYIEDKAHGASALVHTQKWEMEGFELALPKGIGEQKTIAKALGDVDELIVSLEKLIAKKRDIKTAAMQQLLTGKKRLPGYGEGKGYKQTELGEIPEDWDVKPLSAVCSMKSGESITNANIKDGEPYPCYGGNGLRGYTNKYTHDGEYALVGRQGALCGNVQGVCGQFFASEHAIVVTPTNETDIRWLTHILWRMNLNQYSESSAQPGLSVTKLLPLNIIAPHQKFEQESIANTLIDTENDIKTLKLRLEKTKSIKQGMMQELLTGRTRLIAPQTAEYVEEERLHGT